MADYYRAADVFALSSRYEPFGMTAVEAMACGIASVATEVGGVPEIVEHGQSCLLVPPAEPEAITAALERLAGDSALRDRLGAAARAQVETELTIERMVVKHEALYKQFLSTVTGPSAR